MTRFSWEDVYFPEAVFPISEFLSKDLNQVQIWDLAQWEAVEAHRLVQELQAYQPVVIGINDRRTTNGLVLERLIKQIFPRILTFFNPDCMTVEQLLDQANKSAFSLRNRTRPMSGKIRMRRNWKEDELFAFLPPEKRMDAHAQEADFCERYQLQEWKNLLSASDYRKNIYIIEMLTDALPDTASLWQKSTLRLLDIGAGNWAYAIGLYQFFQHHLTDKPRKVYLTGIELDPYRIDAEGYSNADYALSYIDRIASHCRYQIQDVLEYQSPEPCDAIFQFLPLVLPQAHLIWGLPLNYFHPLEQLKHLWQLLCPGGSLVVANEMIQEYETQQQLFAQTGIQATLKGAFYSNLRHSYTGFVSVAQR